MHYYYTARTHGQKTGTKNSLVKNSLASIVEFETGAIDEMFLIFFFVMFFLLEKLRVDTRHPLGSFIPKLNYSIVHSSVWCCCYVYSFLFFSFLPLWCSVFVFFFLISFREKPLKRSHFKRIISLLLMVLGWLLFSFFFLTYSTRRVGDTKCREEKLIKSSWSVSILTKICDNKQFNRKTTII